MTPYPPTHARLDWRARAAATAVVVALAVAPFFLAPYATTTLTRMLVYALLAAGLDLLVGITGLPSLGHAAYFGVGAYAAGWIAANATPAMPVALLVAAGAGAVTAAATGWVAVRSAGIFFLILTLAIAEIIQQLAESWEPVTGGSNGMYGIPATRVAGEALTNIAHLHWYVLAWFLVGLIVLWSLSASPLGATLRGIRDNEPRMRALGYHTFRYKLAAFVAAGAVAGLAGGLLAAQQRLVTPADLGFTTSALALLAVVIGGTGTIWGPCLGAALVVLVRDSLGPSLGGHGPLVLGLVFIAVVYALPRGVAGLRRPAQTPSATECRGGAMTDVLHCVGVRRAFGALRAVDGVDLTVAPGTRHALIGPNGAGKSTLLRLIAGGMRVNGGRIWLDGRDITGVPEAHRARLGIGQTFQHSSLFRTLTAADNVALAVQRRRGRPWLPLPRRPTWGSRVNELLAVVGLDDRADHRVDTLSYAECRLLEVAVTLAAEPHVLLLDEPAAGMSAASTARLLDLLRRLPGEITLIFVEHDLDLAFELATDITVLHLGRVLMSGAPADVRASDEVQRAYLGTGRRAELFTAPRSTGDGDVAARS